MRFAAWIIIGLCAAGTLAAQNRDFSTMTNAEFLQFLAERDAPAQHDQIEQVTPGVKCPLDLTFEIIRRREIMSSSEFDQMQQILAALPTQKTITSPSGRFKVIYDTTGEHTPAMLDGGGFRIQGTYHQYATAVADMCDETYQKEVVELGYPAPPNPPYEVYLYAEEGGNYGATYPVGLPLNQNTAAPTTNSYIRMDNDFAFYPTRGLDGARVTVAHEFHHMIQLGRYGAWGQAHQYFYEMTSTRFEDIVYPDVNDYFNYLPQHFKAPEVPFYSPVDALTGYQKAIFIEMIDKKYGLDVIYDIWDNIKRVDPANAVNQALVTHNTDYGRELCNFGKWSYYTNYRSEQRDLSERWNEAGRFPLAAYESVTQLNNGRADFTNDIYPYGSMYFRVYRGADTVCIIVSNTDWSAAITTSSRGTKTPFSISVVDYQPGDPYVALDNGWSYKFEAAAGNFLCHTVIVGEAAQEAPISTAYPNPFFVGTDDAVRFPMPAITTQQRANLYIYTASMNLVYHADEVPILSEEGLGRFMQWNGKTDSGEEPATGVYFYAIKFGDDVRKGKFAVVRK